MLLAFHLSQITDVCDCEYHADAGILTTLNAWGKRTTILAPEHGQNLSPLSRQDFAAPVTYNALREGGGGHAIRKLRTQHIFTYSFSKFFVEVGMHRIMADCNK